MVSRECQPHSRTRQRVKLNMPKKRHKPSPLQQDILCAAMHEAGHAFAYAKLGIGVEYVTIERKYVKHAGQVMYSSGFTQPKPRKLSRETIEAEAVCVMAGPASEGSANGDGHSGSHGDMDNLRDYALALGMSKAEAVELVERSYRTACDLLEENFATVQKIAFELMTKGRIEEAALLAIVNGTQR